MKNNPDKPIVLLIDDDRQIRDVMQKALESSGYIALVAENGKVGMEIYRNEKPDIVITDLFMPEKEGLETIQEIRSINPDAKIIAISGGSVNTSLDFLPLASKLGASAALEKPFSIAALIGEINKLID